MRFSDFFIAPPYIAIIYLLAYIAKPYVTDSRTQRYFMLALTLKIVGALSFGLVYQFYYGGGDTFSYYYNSSQIYKALTEDFLVGVQLLFGEDRYDPVYYQYSTNMFFFYDNASMFVVKMAAIFSFFCFNSYAVISVLFAFISFTGLWSLYRTFYEVKPHLYRSAAYAVLFLPSVIFWGSGLMKDTLTIGAVGWLVYSVYKIFIKKENIFISSLVLLAAIYVILSIKIYILLCLLPALILWITLRYTNAIKNTFLRYVVTPFMLLVAALAGYYAIKQVGAESERYSLEKLTETAAVTAWWHTHVSEQQDGSMYTLGDDDYSTTGIIRKILPAINVSLFRPYFWEAKSLMMLFSALESFILLLFTLYVLYRRGLKATFQTIKQDYMILFCLIFALSFAFAVGISTYNFGSLVRYKIPMIPFYVAALVMILHPSPRRVVVKRRKKVVRFAATENSDSTVSRAALPIR